MLLRGEDGTYVRLDLAGYEFGADRLVRDATGAAQEWDANWLVVSGAVALPDGRRWSFRDPALTTWEAAQLARWLQQAADASQSVESPDAAGVPRAGGRAPSRVPVLAAVLGDAGSQDGWPWDPLDAPATSGAWLSFTEPDLAFATASWGGGGDGRDVGVHLLVGLALEAAPPPPPSPPGQPIATTVPAAPDEPGKPGEPGDADSTEEHDAPLTVVVLRCTPAVLAAAAADWAQQVRRHPPR